MRLFYVAILATATFLTSAVGTAESTQGIRRPQRAEGDTVATQRVSEESRDQSKFHL